MNALVIESNKVNLKAIHPKTIFPIKQTNNGHKFINLGCGLKIHPEWTNVDFSPYTLMRKHMWISKMLNKIGILSDLRWDRLNKIPEDICSWNMIKGIPFHKNSFDAVYNRPFS